MKKLSKLTALALSATMAFALAACSGGPTGTTPTPGANPTSSASAAPKTTAATPAEGAHYNIGIVQLMDHVALNGARAGFIQALEEKGLVDGKNLTIDYKDGNGDNNNLSTIADQFVADKKDLVLAIATPAAQAVAAKTTTMPILATAVTDFVAAGLVDSNEAPGGNISGSSDLNPVAEQFDLLFQLAPEAKTVGFLYNSSEDNSRIQVEIAKGILDKKGIKYVERTVSNQNEVQQATQSIISECDAIYLPTDNVFASTMPVVQDITVSAKIPVICGENGMVNSGGLASIGITYTDLGRRAGLMAAEILLNNADISKMPVEFATEYEYLINKDTADGLGITIPAELQQYVAAPKAQ